MHFHLATLTDYDTWATFRQELYADLDPAHSETEIHRIANDPALTTFLVFSKNPNLATSQLAWSKCRSATSWTAARARPLPTSMG